VIVSVPTANVEVLKVAVPEEFRVPVPSVVLPSLKVTVPVGAAEPVVWATVAGKVTVWPDAAGFSEELTEVVVAVVPAAVIVSVKGLLLLLLEA
jgi:hypothetical protein